jgi:hypothetical protein
MKLTWNVVGIASFNMVSRQSWRWFFKPLSVDQTFSFLAMINALHGLYFC